MYVIFRLYSSGVLAVCTTALHICWIRKGALCFASCVYCEPWLVWIQECEELIIETQSDLIPPSLLRPCSPNTLRPCTAEASYLFFLSCWARLHTARTRGSHAFQQWCIMDHRGRWERADCREGGMTPPQCPFHTSTAFFHLLLPLRLLLGQNFNIPGLRLGISVMSFDPLPVQYANKNSNVHVYITSAITNQKPFSSCLVLGVLVPRQWPQNWSWSLGTALWLLTAPEQLGWVQCRGLISP